MKKTNLILAAAAVATLVAVDSAHAELIYGLTTNSIIFSFDSATPNNLISGKFITGLAANETLVSMDVRPANGLIYGVGSSNTLYTINPTTGVASSVAPLTGAGFTGLNGTGFGSDFNPVADAFRLVSNTGQNLAINPTTGVVTVQTNLNASYGQPSISGAAYTNNFVGAATTTLYTIDSGINYLNTQNPALGTQTQVNAVKDSASTTVDVTSLLGFDISGVTGNAYVAFQQGVNGYSQFAQINLTTGVLSGITANVNTGGLIGGGLFVQDIAAAVPEPTLVSMAGMAVLGLTRRRRA